MGLKHDLLSCRTSQIDASCLNLICYLFLLYLFILAPVYWQTMANSSSTQSSVPRDVTVIQSILKDMGVTDYEPAVVNQLLDFCYRM